MSQPTRFLEGRHAVVTGGGRGIGAAVAAELAALGAKLTLMGRNVEALERHAALLEERHSTPVAAVACDVAEEDAVERAFAAARERHGDPLVLINNAGVAEGAPLRETTPELWNRLLAVNLTGTYLCSRAAIDGMLAAGWGRIVNVASVAGLQGRGRLTAYTAAKHGVVGFTRALAHEVAKRGVTVNAVCPAYTDTDMAEHAVQSVSRGTGMSAGDARALIERSIPLGRLVDPSEVASLVAWLCSPAAAATTGTAIPVAGGEVG
jgi:NAD(P)-dependent dehydrogenase (short-subunit alcohol dehydrogenase family)